MMYTISSVTFTQEDAHFEYEVLLIVQLGDGKDTPVSGYGDTQADALYHAAKRVEGMMELKEDKHGD